MTTIIRDRIRSMIDKRMTLAQLKAAGPSKDYDGVYSTPARIRRMTPCFRSGAYTCVTLALVALVVQRARRSPQMLTARRFTGQAQAVDRRSSSSTAGRAMSRPGRDRSRRSASSTA